MPGTTVADLGKSPDQYNPFGMAFAPDGTLYFVDIHITCTGPLTGCGPASYGGRVMRVTFTEWPTVGAGDGGGRLRLPDQRDRVRPGADAMSLPVGEDQGPVVGPRRRTRRPPRAPRPTSPGNRRLRLRTLHARGRRAARTPAWCSSAWRRRSGFGRRWAPSPRGGRAGRRQQWHPAQRRRARPPSAGRVSPWDWPAYGHDAQHTFHGRTTLTETSVRTLRRPGSSRPATPSPRRPQSSATPSTRDRGTTTSTR